MCFPSYGYAPVCSRRRTLRPDRIALKMAVLVHPHMQDRDGHFYFRHYARGINNKAAMIHWGQATMHKALAHLVIGRRAIRKFRLDARACRNHRKKARRIPFGKNSSAWLASMYRRNELTRPEHIVDEQLHVYVGWTCHHGSYADCLPIKERSGTTVLFFAGEHYSPEGGEEERPASEFPDVLPTRPKCFSLSTRKRRERFFPYLNGFFHGLDHRFAGWTGSSCSTIDSACSGSII